MRVYTGIFIVISLLFLVGTVAAVGIPDKVTVTSDKLWIVANNVDQSTITVTVTNTTPGPDSGFVSGVTVNLDVDDHLYGTLSPIQVTTNSSGMALSTFKVRTKSGAAKIFANITAPELSTSTNQDIDHNSAYYADFTHPLSGTVASEVPFNISITDRWGNPIDNRKQVIPGDVHTLSLHVHGPFPDDCGFVTANTSQHDISSTLDVNGNSSLTVRLTQKTGPNNILMDAFGSIPDKLEWIDADTNGIPFSMDQVYSPPGSPPTLPADGVMYFTIKYTLFDKYGNPAKGQWLWVNTSVAGEEKKFQSNNLGQISVQYGPRSSIGAINITATTLVNNTVTLSQTVEFMNTEAEIISLTANPDTMASLDANPSRISDILAMVADHTGNAVAGESVNFTIQNITYDATTYNVTADPVLLSTSNITDVNGVAAVQFRPGSFTTLGNPNYSASATGHCDVIATWNGTHKTVPVTWKNYPYLSVKTAVTPLTVEINKTIDVSIEFRGDGWALQPSPIEVVLCTDRSGSMLYDNPDRMYSIREAGKVFIDALKPGTDKVGLVTFGRSGSINTPGEHSFGNPALYIDNTYTVPKTYSSYATFDRNLTTDFTLVKSDLDAIVPDYGTPMRLGVYKSVKELNALGQTNGTVKAIVLLSDGDYNFYGDPLARGAGSTNPADWYGDLTSNYYQFSDLSAQNQNLSVYAKNNNIRIYSIGYANTLTAGGRTSLRILAEGSGGKYYNASSTDIADVYKEIAQELKDNAGVNTSMIVDFENVNVTGVTMPGDQVFDYVYDPAASTKINWQNGTTTVPAINQSADWAADNKLDFIIGTIKVGQFWNATFRLRVNQSGMIDVFGKNSTVTFNGGNETLNLPQTFITVVPTLNVTVIGAKTITLVNLTVTEPGEIKALLPVMWYTNYTGNKTITEKVYYSIDDGPWVLFDIKTHAYNATTMEYIEYAQLDVTKLPPGGYKIMVYATASDAPDATIMLDNPVNVGNRGRTYIKLQ